MTEAEDRMALGDRLAEAKVQMSATPLGADATVPKWASGMMGWRCTLRAYDRSMTLKFWMGAAHGGERPTTEDVMECLLSDAASYENAEDAADFAAGLGFEGREGEQVYVTLGKQTERLKRLLGDQYEAWVWASDAD